MASFCRAQAGLTVIKANITGERRTMPRFQNNARECMGYVGVRDCDSAGENGAQYRLCQSPSKLAVRVWEGLYAPTGGRENPKRQLPNKLQAGISKLKLEIH